MTHEGMAMTHKDVLLAVACITFGLCGTSAQAQGTGGTLKADIGSKGEIIAGSDWISNVSRAGDDYVVVFKTPFQGNPDCTPSLAANAPTQGLQGANSQISYESKAKVQVQTFSIDRQFQDHIFQPLPFHLECTFEEDDDET